MGQDDSTSTDPLQPQDDIFNPNVDQVQLEEDGSSPDTPAEDVAEPTGYSLEHPATDTGVDDSEAYDAGVGNAAGLGDQHEEPDTHVKPVDLDHQD